MAKRRLDKGKSRETAPLEDDDVQEEKIEAISDTEGTLEAPQRDRTDDMDVSDSGLQPPNKRQRLTPIIEAQRAQAREQAREQAAARAELFRLLERYQQEIIKLQQELSNEKNKRWRLADQVKHSQLELASLRTDYDDLKRKFELEQKEKIALEAAWAEKAFLSYDSDK